MDTSGICVGPCALSYLDKCGTVECVCLDAQIFLYTVTDKVVDKTHINPMWDFIWNLQVFFRGKIYTETTWSGSENQRPNPSALHWSLTAVFFSSSCLRWRCTAWVRGFIVPGGSRRSSGSRWWSSCSVWRSWSSTAACVESPSGTGTKSCRPYLVPTFSISSGCSSTPWCLSCVTLDFCCRSRPKQLRLHCFYPFRCLQTNGTKGCPKCFKSSLKPGFVWWRAGVCALDVQTKREASQAPDREEQAASGGAEGVWGVTIRCSVERMLNSTQCRRARLWGPDVMSAGGGGTTNWFQYKPKKHEPTSSPRTLHVAGFHSSGKKTRFVVPGLIISLTQHPLSL